MSEKRCTFCGHPGRLTPILNRWVDRIDGWKCTSPIACIRRQEQLGQWIGKRVLRRIDADGTEWVIRRAVGAPPRPDVEGRDFVLAMTYREQRLTSWHTSPEAAKAHVEEFLASLTDRDIDAYRDEVADEQMELL